MSYARITQTAKYLPERVVTNQELTTMMDTTDEWIYSRTGIKQRHVVTNQSTSDLCVEVGRQLLQKSGYEAESMDFIIVATMTADYAATPSTACLLQGKLGCTSALSFDVNAACSGFIYALSTAEKFISSGKYQRGLVIGAETMSKIIDWEDRGTAVLFGDGAAGVLLEASPDRQQFLAEKISADGLRANSLTAAYRENKSPFAEKTPASPWLTMDGRDIFDFSLRNVSKNILSILEENNLDGEQIDFVLAHQANVRIIEAVAKKSKIPREKFLCNIEFYGNTSAASVAILLHDSVESGKIKLGTGQKIVLTGFGGGLTWGSLLLSI